MTLARRIGIVGSGRVARALARGLGAHSAAAPLLWGRTVQRAQEAAASQGWTAVQGLHELVEACDLIALAVSDDAVQGVVTELSELPFPADRAALVFHVSGARGVAVLDPLRSQGVRTAAIHPVMTFTGDHELERGRLVGARFAVTASGRAALEGARAVVAALGGVFVEIAEADRALYHAALCHGANHLVTLLSGAMEGLAAAGVAQPGALLAPLVHAALENTLEQGFGALSGPLLRGDSGTIAGHLAALEATSPALQEAYRAMARATLEGLEGRETAELRALLGAGRPGRGGAVDAEAGSGR
ncbi:Rossmann-like and DUF2520 domain-containing protein [Novosphingobium soli]|uniref:Rossmann-like and DUF2520 domain-containing protein n=1 Tax=Novosphingobium soli TaxID=574956 RepID=A0ABV6CSD8_9SPHN